MKHAVSILNAIADKDLFAPWFKDRATWQSWFVFLAALFALRMTSDQLDVYRRCTGRTTSPTEPAKEAWLICGRRAGKSFILALCAVFSACFRDWTPHLAPGERATIMVIASDRGQARTIFRYIGALLTRVPMLAELIERETIDSFDLSNSVTIEVQTASSRSTRGYTIAAALCDELAFWPSYDAAEPDHEILAAIKPGMATIPGAMLLCASSPYARRGALFDAHRKHFGKDNDPILVWQADTRTMNPTVPQSVIDEAMERNPASAAAEYGAEFRRDIESLIAIEAVRACVSARVYERAPQYDIIYYAFCDPSRGSGDPMALAIGHKDYAKQTVVIDALREVRAPFSPEAVVGEFAPLLKSYRVTQIVGDGFLGAWLVEQFAKFGICYEPSAKPKSSLYVDLVPLINSMRIDLLDHAKLIDQLCALERRNACSGRDSIDHPPGAHDDVANAVAGVAAAINKYGDYDISLAGFQPDSVDRDVPRR